jgi:hypothetical protein
MNGEKGQALPLAMLALTIGALLIAPFLGHAGSSLIGSRTYASSIVTRNAADAGAEHAIWSLTRGTLATQIPNLGDHITYQLGEALNGVNTSVTVTTNATGGGGVVGDILNTIIDTLNFDNTYCDAPSIINVSGNVYAIAYEGPSSDGFLKTVEISPEGNIANSAIDTLEFDTSDCYEPDIIQVSGNTFAIAYHGPSDDGFLKTVSIAANGDIGNSVIDTLEFDTGDCSEPDIIQVSGSTFTIAYCGPSSDGFLKSVSIAANGDIGNSVIDTLEYNTGNGNYPNIILVSGSIFAIAYQGSGSDGYITTVQIAASGDIINSVIDNLDFDTSTCSYPDIINISGTTYAVAYQGNGSNGFIKTMTISAAGVISNSAISSFEFDTNDGREPRILYITADTYALAYRGQNNDGFVITLPINASGTIPGTITDTLEYDTSNGYYPDIIKISANVFAIAYGVPSDRGSLVTVGISAGSTAAAYRIVSTAGSMTISALVNTNNTTASIISWQIQ